MYHSHYNTTTAKFPRDFTIWNATDFKSRLRVVLADHSLWQRDGTEIIAGVQEVIVHQDYSELQNTVRVTIY